MKKKLLVMALLMGGSAFAATHVSIGVGIGVPAYYGGYSAGYYAPAPPVAVYRPPCPGPGYSWVNGYWGPRHVWISGYWAAPYIGSYWGGGRHRDWDHDRDWRRDWDHDRGWRRGRR